MNVEAFVCYSVLLLKAMSSHLVSMCVYLQVCIVVFVWNICLCMQVHVLQSMLVYVILKHLF